MNTDQGGTRPETRIGSVGGIKLVTAYGTRQAQMLIKTLQAVGFEFYVLDQVVVIVAVQFRKNIAGG